MKSQNTAPFFTVITPSWNQGAFLPACLDSVIHQNDPDFEHLVFDNCSSDSTRAVAARYPHVRFLSEPDRGQSHAVNKGLAAARGEIICWLNADDIYQRGSFTLLREIFADSSVHVVYGDVEQVSYDGRGPQVLEAVFSDRLDLVRWWSSRARLHQPAVFFRRSAADSVGLLREDLHYAMDYEYWWRLSEKFPFHRTAGTLAIQHRQPQSKTVKSWHKVYEERETIFAPFYDLIDHGDRAGLMREKRQDLAVRYLTQAYAAAPSDKIASLQNLSRALHENPRYALHARSLGLLRSLFGTKRVISGSL